MQLDAFLPYLLVDLPACPDVTAKQQLVLTAIEFCRETLSWDEIQDPLTLVDGVNAYELDAPQGGQVATVKQVWASDRELTPVSMARLVEVIPNWQTAQGSQAQYYVGDQDWKSIRVYPIPLDPQGQRITVRAAYQPVLAAASLPDFLATIYMDAILAGAKARLMSTPGRQWTNHKLAADHRAAFDAALIQARIDILHERVQGSLQVRPRRFGYF